MRYYIISNVPNVARSQPHRYEYRYKGEEVSQLGRQRGTAEKERRNELNRYLFTSRQQGSIPLILIALSMHSNQKQLIMQRRFACFSDIKESTRPQRPPSLLDFGTYLSFFSAKPSLPYGNKKTLPYQSLVPKEKAVLPWKIEFFFVVCMKQKKQSEDKGRGTENTPLGSSPIDFRNKSWFIVIERISLDFMLLTHSFNAMSLRDLAFLCLRRVHFESHLLLAGSSFYGNEKHIHSLCQKQD